MLEKIIQFSLKNKLIIILFIATVIGFGIFSLSRIPIGAVPDITNNQVQVITTTRNLLYTGNIVVDETLEYTPKALRNAVYDPKSIDKGKLERLDDTELEFNPIDVVDAVEYGVSYFEKYK